MLINGVGLPCLQVLLAQDHFLLVARSDHTTGSRNIKPEVVFKVQKMARYASFCLTIGPFKGEVPVFGRYGPLRLRIGFYEWGSTVGHPNNSWASCWIMALEIQNRIR